MQPETDYTCDFDENAVLRYANGKYRELNIVDQQAVDTTIQPMDRIGINKTMGKRIVKQLSHGDRLELLMLLGTWVNMKEASYRNG